MDNECNQLVAMTTVTEYDFDRTCRSCLCTSSNLKSLFETYVSFGDKQNDETKFSGRRTRRSGLSMHTDEQRVKVHEVIGVFSDVQVSLWLKYKETSLNEQMGFVGGVSQKVEFKEDSSTEYLQSPLLCLESHLHSDKPYPQLYACSYHN